MESTIFRTTYQAKPEENQIDYRSTVVLIGSCFSENIGKKFDYYKFNSLINPHGIVFNPLAVKTVIEDCLSNKKFTNKDIFTHNNLWHSFDHHSVFSDQNPNDVLKNIQEKISLGNEKISKASHIIITFGSAWYYTHHMRKKNVANCHKIPQKEFDKKLMSVAEVSKTISSIKELLEKANPTVEIIFTVSPVRHLKDGMIENNLSKANLRAAIHENLAAKTHYFPAYEIVIDDLRDYRFYDEDMVHPNKTAINYIWEAFKKTWIDASAETLMKQVATIQKGLQHKAFNPDTEQHKNFLKNLTLKKEMLAHKHGIHF